MERSWRYGPTILAAALAMAAAVHVARPGFLAALGTTSFWITFLITFLVIWLLLSARRRTAMGPEEVEATLPVMLPEVSQEPAVRDVMDVKMARREPGFDVYEGRLLAGAEETLSYLLGRLAGSGRTPLLQEGRGGRVDVVIVPGAAMETPAVKSHPWLHWGLLFLTFLTTTYVGARFEGVDLLKTPQQVATGLSYSFGLLLILGFHEMGHFFTARFHGMKVTPPFFIPVPFALGTFGAFIQLRSPAPRRKALFDVAVAGPLAGLVVAIPALLIGLKQSAVVPESWVPQHPATHGSVTSSILMSVLARLSLGEELGQGTRLLMSPLAFAGWLGLMVTALNLLPIGQLDGGHIVHAMFGRRGGQAISTVSMWVLFLLAFFVWQWLLPWALIVFFLAGARGAPPVNDVTPIGTGRRLLGYAAFAILLLILLPLPEGLDESMGLLQ